MNMNWLNTNYILRAGVLSVLLLLPGLISACLLYTSIAVPYSPEAPEALHRIPDRFL